MFSLVCLCLYFYFCKATYSHDSYCFWTLKTVPSSHKVHHYMPGNAFRGYYGITFTARPRPRPCPRPRPRRDTRSCQHSTSTGGKPILFILGLLIGPPKISDEFENGPSISIGRSPPIGGAFHKKYVCGHNSFNIGGIVSNIYTGIVGS